MGSFMDFGFWSLMPPLVAIGLAFITKRVVPALLAGILVGALIATGGNVPAGLAKAALIIWHSTELANLASTQSFFDSWNLFILLFTITLTYSLFSAFRR